MCPMPRVATVHAATRGAASAGVCGCVSADEAVERLGGETVGRDLCEEVGVDGLVGSRPSRRSLLVKARSWRRWRSCSSRSSVNGTSNVSGVGTDGVGVPADGGDQRGRVAEAHRQRILGFGAVEEEVLKQLVAEVHHLLGLEPKDVCGLAVDGDHAGVDTLRVLMELGSPWVMPPVVRSGAGATIWLEAEPNLLAG
jgi:hypothetical protein